jgi:hypothetical protein
MVESVRLERLADAITGGMGVCGRIGDVADERAAIDLRLVRQRSQQLTR